MEGFPMSESPDSLTVPHNHPTSSECEGEKSGAIIFKLETEQDLERKRIQDSQESVRRLQDFLQEDEEDMDQYLLSSKTLLRYALLMDVVQPSSRRSVCFTKGCAPYDIPMYYDKYFIYFTYMFYKKKNNKSFIFKFYNYLYMHLFYFFTWCFLQCFQPPIGVHYLTCFTILKMISSANIFAVITVDCLCVVMVTMWRARALSCSPVWMWSLSVCLRTWSCFLKRTD